jgi:hypothetical protein
MTPSVLNGDRLALGVTLRVGIQRTLRIPDDGRTYPLPPALGRLPIRSGSEYTGFAERGWSGSEHFIVPMRRQEAAWLQFQGKLDNPQAVKVGVGGVDALTGMAWDERLRRSPQNYIVCPYQPWLDGFKIGAGVVRQFVAVPIGAGLSVEHQRAERETGGIRLASFAATPDALAGRAVPRRNTRQIRNLAVGAGGRIKQRIYPDPLGFNVWERSASGTAWIHLVDADEYARVTGERVSPSPIDAETYSRFGFPWFDVYDSARGDLPTTALAQIKSVDDLAAKGKKRQPAARRPGGTLNVRPIPPRARRKR